MNGYGDQGSDANDLDQILQCFHTQLIPYRSSASLSPSPVPRTSSLVTTPCKSHETQGTLSSTIDITPLQR